MYSEDSGYDFLCRIYCQLTKQEKIHNLNLNKKQAAGFFLFFYGNNKKYIQPCERAKMSTVTISTLEELKAFRDAVNSGTSYKGQTVELSADIDLKGEEWTPIGRSGKNFQGIFNGNGHTVSNLVINQPGKSDIGFFGITTDGEIKNLTIHNADVKGRLDVDAVAGTPYTSKYTNIKLTGDVKVEGYAYVGGMFGKNAYANLTGLTIDANSGSYVKAESEGYRTYVGGVIGFMGEGNQTVQNVTSNLDVIGSTCDVGGIAGNAHYGNRFINVTCTAEKITLENAIDTGDHLEIGGIVGVWLNTENQTVLIINSSAPNATLKSALNGEDKSEEVKNNTVAGKSYGSETAASGSLLIGTETKTESGTTLTFTVSGPKAAEDLEKAFGPLQANEDGTFTAQTTYLVRIGSNYYDTLDAALAAAKNGDTLTLLGNITLDSMLTVGKDITIDGAGQYSITASENDAWKGRQMIQVSKANVTFKDLTLDGAGQSLTLIQAAAATGLTLDGVTMQNARNGIYKGSTFDNGGVTISNSTINVKVYAFNASGKLAFVNVSGSTLYGWTSYASSLTEASGSFKDTKFFEADDRGLNGIVAALRPYFPTVVDNCQFSEAFSMTTGDYYNENGLSIGKSNVVMNLDKVSVIKADGSASDVPLADLVSGKFDGSGGSAVSDVAFVVDGVKDEASGKYSGGTFIGDSAVIASTLAEGLAPKANEDGTYSAAIPDMTNILVNSGWTSMKPGEVIPGQDGFNFGFNAFDKLSGAADGMTADTATIKLTGDVEESTDAAAGAATNRNFNFRATQDLVLTADAATIKLTVDDSLKTHGGSTNSTGELAFLSDSDDRRATITIDKNVTINTNAKVWFGRTAVTKEVHATDVIINGTINQQKNTDTNSYGIMQIQSDKGSTVTLNGTIYLDWSLLVKGSTFTVTGTGLLGRSAGSWHDTYVSVEKREDLGGKFILDGGETANLSALAVNELSSAELKNGANADFSQSATISSGASLTISNSNLTTETLTNNGAITMDSGSFLAFGSYAGTSAITINTAGYDKTKIAKLIDYTGTGSVDYGTIIGNYDSDLFTVLDNDLFIGNADMSVIQVNSVWAGNAPGTEVAEGYYFGFNAFDNANDAINAAGANATVRIQGTGENTTPITRKSYMENLTVETPEGGSSHLCMHAGSTTYIYGEEAENGDAVRHEATVEYKNQDISFAGHSHFESLAGMTVKFTGSKVGHEGGTPFFKVYGDSNVVFDNSTYNAKNGNLWFYVSGQLDLQKNSLLNIETGSGFRILAAGGKVNVDESGLAVSNTNITIGSYYINSDKTAKAIVGGKKQGHDADGGNDYSATLNITNGRLVNKNGFVRVGASYILDDAATDEREGLTIKANPDKPADYADLAKAYLNITGSSAADLNELYVDGNGIVTVQDSSKLTAKAVTVDGKLTISHGSAMTVSGVLSVSGDSNAGRGITVDGTGFISGTKAVISAGSIVWNKNILASGLETGMTLAVTNNAVYLTDQNQDTVYVGGKNADGVPEANTAGAGIAGWNAFDTILDAVNAIGMTPDKTVFDFGNAAKTYTETVQNETDKVEFTQAGKYTFTGGELAHLPYLHGNAADAKLVFDKAKLTLSKVKMEKGSSLTVMDSQLDFHPHSGDLAFLSLYNDGIMNVAGSVVGISDEMNDTDMPKAGKAGNSDTNGVYLAKDGMSRMSLTIQGQVNMTDSTLFASYRSRVLAGTRGQGEMNLKNSVMYADGLQILQATEDTGKATVNLDASALIQSHYSSSASLYSLVIGNDEAANAAAVISLTNGSLLDWSKAATARMPYEPWPASDSVVINTNGTLEIKGNSTAKTGNITNTGAIVIDNGKLEAAAVANNGTFSVSGTGDLSGSFSGNVFNFAAGAVLTSSKGFTFDGDYVTDSLTAIGAGEFSFGKLRFNVDKANPKSVEVKIGKDAVVKVANVMEIDRRTAKDPDTVDENVTGILTLEDGAKVTVGTEAAEGWFYNKFEASTNISTGAELNVYGEFQNKGYFTVNGTLNLYSVSRLGMTAAGRDGKGGIMNIDGGVVNYSDTDASKGWFGIGTKRHYNPTWDDATDTKTSELNITNGGQLNINLLEGNPYDTAFGIGQYGKLSVAGEGAAVNAASAGLQNNGKILLQDKANMTLGKLISSGTITVSNSTLTVSGDLTLNGSFSFDLASTITVGNLTNSGTITIDMNNVEAGQIFKLIDHTGTGTGSSYGDVTLINNAGSYRTIVIDNDLYAVSKSLDLTDVAVNAAWAGTEIGKEVAAGEFFGLNAFDTTDNLSGLPAMKTLSITDTTAGGALDLTKFDSLAMTVVNSTLTDLALANSSSLNMDGSSIAGDISAAGSLTINGDAAVNTVKTAAADAELNINGLTVNQGISGFTTISTNGATVKKGGITLTAGNDVMNVNGMLISMADGIDFLDGSNSLTLSSAASVVAYGIYATNGSLDLTLTLADNVGKAIITVADDGIFADAASTISLDVSKLQVGSYILVNNLSSFSKRIQVNGDTLGIGESLNINGMRYTLNYSNKTLSLDVTDFIVGNDIDNNGYADILMFNQKKEAALWLMKSNGTAEWKELFPFAGGDIADGWTLFDTGDTMGNNYSDVILYNEQDKDVGVWQMSDGETTWRTLERLDSDHELVAVRDFNGNGKQDILSRGTDGSLQFHYTDSGKTERFELSNEWKVVGAGDINGDGKADVIFQNGTKTGAWLTGAENEMPQWRDLYDLGTADNSILGTGDFDGNGIADVLIATKNSNGTVSYGTWLMNAQTEAPWRTLVTLPASVVIESISDINGDGKAELRVRNGNDIASISMSVSLDSNTVLTQWNSHGPVTDEWTTKLASPIL